MTKTGLLSKRSKMKSNFHICPQVHLTLPVWAILLRENFKKARCPWWKTIVIMYSCILHSQICDKKRKKKQTTTYDYRCHKLYKWWEKWADLKILQFGTLGLYIASPLHIPVWTLWPRCCLSSVTLTGVEMVVVWLSGQGAFFGWGHPEVTRGWCYQYQVQTTQESSTWLILRPADKERGHDVTLHYLQY